MSDMVGPDGLLHRGHVWLRPCSYVAVVTFDPDALDRLRTENQHLREQSWAVNDIRHARLSCSACRPGGCRTPRSSFCGRTAKGLHIGLRRVGAGRRF